MLASGQEVLPLMLRSLPWLVVCVSVAGCGDPNAGALFAEIEYATECRETPGCEAEPNRLICGINQGDPCPEVGGVAMLSCSVTETMETRIISFSANQGTGFSLSVSQMIVPFGGGSAGGGSCNVRVVEDPNRYEGACGSGTPTGLQPCQISNIEFCDDLGNPTLRGDIFCQMLAHQTSPLLQIELHQTGFDTTARGAPGRFRLANCDGLEVPDTMPCNP